MAEVENSKDLISVLWSGADILRSKMDANEYKDYLLGIVFYKYLSDSFLIKVYDLICDARPQTLKEALDAYVEELKGEDAEELKKEMQDQCHYVIEPELTYTYFADAARNNSFNREQLQKAFNNIEQSDQIFGGRLKRIVPNCTNAGIPMHQKCEDHRYKYFCGDHRQLFPKLRYPHCFHYIHVALIYPLRSPFG